MPLLVWHRQNWNIVYPNVSLDDGEPETLKMSYVAGFTNPAIETHQELYDVLVNGMCVCVINLIVSLVIFLCVFSSSCKY